MLLLDIILLRSLTLILLLYAADCYSGSAVRLSNDYQTIQATFFVLLATSCFASSCFSPFSFLIFADDFLHRAHSLFLTTGKGYQVNVM